MKLDFVTQDFPPVRGGIQTYSAELTARLAERGMEVKVHAPHHDESDKYDDSFPCLVKRYRIPSSHLGLRLLFQYPKSILKDGVDAVLHAQWQTVRASVRARSKGSNIKIFCAAHGRELFLNPYSFSKSGDLSQRFLKNRLKLFQQIDHFFVVSEFTAEALIQSGVDANAITVVHNGTDPSQFYPSIESGQAVRKKLGFENRKIIYSIARLVPTKGIDTVIDALPKVILKDPDILYVIGGKGPDEARLKEKVSHLGLTNHVYFAGYIADEEANAYYNMADLFVMVSRKEGPNVEGFGIVFLEANACGKAVIGSLSGGIPDAVVQGKTGFLVEPNDPDALAERINTLFDNDELRLQMGAQGRKRVVESFNWDVVADQLNKKILSLMKS